MQPARNLRAPRVSTTRVRPISQVTFQLHAADIEKAFVDVRTRILHWIVKRAGKPLPQEAWRGEDFELLDVGAQRTAAVTLATPRYWCARADDADREVPQRTWTTEFGLASSGSELRFGCRLQCATQGDDAPYQPSIPSLIRQIAKELDLRVDNFRVRDRAWYVDAAEDSAALISLLLSKTRRRPIVVVSHAKDPVDEWFSNAAQAGDDLAYSVIGAAHTVVVSERAGFALTDELGKEFSVFNGAVRTYGTGFDPNRDEPMRHPIALPGSIRTWESGPEGFRNFLVAKALRLSVSGHDLENDLPSFSRMRRIAIERKSAIARQAGQSDSELLQLALNEIESLRKQLEDDRKNSDGLLQAAEQEREEAIDERDEAREENHNLRYRLEHLTAALVAKGRAEDVEIPDSLDELQQWAAKYLSGCVFLANRALRAAKKSAFQDVALVYRALLILRDHYVPMRLHGDRERKDAYEAALRAEGLEESASFFGTRASQYGDEYFLDHGGRLRELDRHLKGSNSRDERFGFRIYFFWDESGKQVIIGWLPSHLTTEAS